MIINNNKILILSLVIISLHISFIFGSFMEILRGVYIDCFSAKKVDSLYFLTHWHAGIFAFMKTITVELQRAGAMAQYIVPILQKK